MIDISMLRPEEIIQKIDRMTALAIVMRLTAGTANPSLALSKIDEMKDTKWLTNTNKN